MGWVSPTGHVDSGSHWTDESKAYDENTSTYAIYDLLATGYWTSFLELTHASIVCNSVRFMLPQDTHGGYIYLDIDVYYSGAWHDVYSGTFSNLTWTEKSLGGNYTVTALRIRVYNGTGGGQSLRFHEAAFYQVVAPTVTTQACTAVTGQTATGNGNITATGGANATRRGFCYKTGTSGDPTTADSTAYDTGSYGTGAFTKSITGLSNYTSYRVRAYAINSAGTSYGATVQMKTLADVPTVTTQAVSSITKDTATGNGNITATGGANATRRGFCYKAGTSGDPTTADSTAYDDGDYGVGAFTKGLTSLSNYTSYRVRAYATNSVGTSYGTTVQMKTLATIPTVTTQAVSSILSTTATGNGNITATGGVNATKRGVCYNTTGNPTVADSKVEATGSFGIGAFTSLMTGLSPGIKYYVKAYAYNSEGYAYGAEVDFTTDKVAPTVTTQAPTVVLATTVTANGNITALGGENSTVRGFQYGLTAVATWDAHDDGDFATGAFTKGLTSLTANTSYWIRAYATNSIGTGYGSWVQFQAAAVGVIPTGTKLYIGSDYSGYTYVQQGSETDDGDTYTAYFVISTDLTNKQGLAFYKRILDLHLYFNGYDGGTVTVEVKRDSETTWQSVGTITLNDDEDIIIEHLATDIRAKHFLFKLSATNYFAFLGCLFEYIRGEMR